MKLNTGLTVTTQQQFLSRLRALTFLDSEVGQYYVAVRAVGYGLDVERQASVLAPQRLQPSTLLAKLHHRPTLPA